jgi:predicted DnaQ family exonuclease/DinG family helicase
MLISKEILQEINLNNFIVLDLETTGLDPANDQIIEIGAIRFVNGKEKESFEEIINPKIPIPDFITKLTGISDEDVKPAPTIDKKLGKLLDFMGESIILGHQVNFDAAFIEYLLRIEEQDFTNWENESHRFKYLINKRLDTLFLSRIFLPFLPRMNLGTVASHFNIDLENAHRAIDDARATGHIFIHLIEKAIATDNQVLQKITRLLYKNNNRVKYFFQPILDYKIKNNIKVSTANITEDISFVNQFYNIIGEGDYKLESVNEDVRIGPINENEIVESLAVNGKLTSIIENFENREQQQEMGKHVAQAFNDSEFLVVEAATGTGKSMAYLMPAVEWAVKNRQAGERIIISTNTKNLQEQLFFKDIPSVFTIVDQKFKAVLLKGKSNYLCLDKWKSTLTDINQRLSPQERTRILPLIAWVEQTRTGDISENAGFQQNQNWGLWNKLIAENNYCPGRQCKFYNNCFLIRARNNARSADLVIVNHSLLFSDLVTENSILGEYNNLIIDEAHNIEKTAAEYLGIRFNWWSFRNVYHNLYEQEPKKAGTLVQLEYRLSQSNLDSNIIGMMQKRITRLQTESISLKNIVQQFFAELNANLKVKFQSNSNNNIESKIRYYKNFRNFRDIQEIIDEVRLNLKGCINKLSNLLDAFTDLKTDSFEFQDQIHRELFSIQTDLEMLLNAYEFCINADEDKHVYWLEMPLREQRIDVTFNAVPLNIAELLKINLYSRLNTAIFTSATLAVDNQFSYFQNRIGLNLLNDKPVNTIKLHSPFDLENQVLLGIPDYLDDPRNEKFLEQLQNIIKEIHDHHPTGMLTLFTSYSMLNTLYNQLKTHFEAKHVLLLAQGKSGSRTNIINQFREYKESVLFGTDSFWEGVDVPGDALEILLITKLPFDVPTEPLIAARMEEIKKSGGNPFFEYSVPEAIIKFRQGFGRLIRHKNDFGAVIVCDNRLSRMQYGQQFLNSLPVGAKIFKDKETMFSELQSWFSNPIIN